MKLARRHSLRERKRRGWQERKKVWLAKLEGAEHATEEWVKNEEQKELKAKMEKSVQLSASGVLEEVKKKKTDIQRLLGVADALKELRTIRREASKKEGNAPPIEADERFESTHEALVELLTQQVGVYEREEHALRVLMEEEVMEKMQSHQNKAAAPQEVVVTGAAVSAAVDLTSDPMESCRQFYLQARSSKEALESIRCEWDSYVSPGGSFPPRTADLLATPPSSATWKQYSLKQED